MLVFQHFSLPVHGGDARRTTRSVDAPVLGQPLEDHPERRRRDRSRDERQWQQPHALGGCLGRLCIAFGSQAWQPVLLVSYRTLSTRDYREAAEFGRLQARALESTVSGRATRLWCPSRANPRAESY